MRVVRRAVHDVGTAQSLEYRAGLGVRGMQGGRGHARQAWGCRAVIWAAFIARAVFGAGIQSGSVKSEQS